MDEVENSMPRERYCDNPERPPVSDCRCDDEQSTDGKIDQESLRGLSHDSEQNVETGDDDGDGG